MFIIIVQLHDYYFFFCYTIIVVYNHEEVKNHEELVEQQQFIPCLDSADYSCSGFCEYGLRCKPTASGCTCGSKCTVRIIITLKVEIFRFHCS